MTVAERRIPVASPVLDGNERRYLNDALDRNWITAGKYERAFEEAFARHCGVREAVACSSGSAALHLALAALGIGPGDEVIVPALTFAATAFAVVQCGAVPVVVDVSASDWCIDPHAVERAVTRRTRAILPVHLYGQPAQMAALSSIAEEHGLALVEDAAEAHGATYGSRRVGSLGKAGCFSFYGNKILTSGEGGIVTTDDPDLAEGLRLLSNSGMTAGHGYDHPALGFNYRMSDLAAAVALAQLERIGEFTAARRRVAGWYAAHLPEDLGTQTSSDGRAWWMVAVTVPGDATRIRRDLADQGIETRPVFPPLGSQGALRFYPSYPCPVAEDIAARGIVLPTHTGLTEDDVRRVCAALAGAL